MPIVKCNTDVEMRYKPERALTRTVSLAHRNMRLVVEMRYKPESKVLVFVTRKMIKEWCETSSACRSVGKVNSSSSRS